MKDRYLIISSTNRKGANSLVIAGIIEELLLERGITADILDLEQVPKDFIFSALYENTNQNEGFNSFKELINASNKLFFVIPEYNGSFPGVLKAFVDGLDYPRSFMDKKAALVGHSSGNQGSALALSHFSDILNYLGTHVFAFKPRLPHIEEHLNEKNLLSAPYKKLLEEQVNRFMNF